MSTYTDSQSDLFWDPFASHWEQLGFTGADEVYERYGKLFPGYDPHEENMLYAQTDAQTSGELAAYNLMASNESNRIALNVENRQTMSELGLDSLYRNQGANEELNSLKKDSITRAAIESIDKAKSAAGRSGLSSGSMMSSMDMAVDTVKSKINAANASQSFSRKKTNQSIENLKANVGYLDANRNWVQGSQGKLEQLKSETSLGMANLKMENRHGIRDFDTEMKAGDMYEAWQQDIIESVGKMFRMDPRGENATNCTDSYGEGAWDVATATCTGAPPPPVSCYEACINAGGLPTHCGQDCAEEEAQQDQGDASGDDYDSGYGDEGDEQGGGDWDYGDSDYDDYGDYDYGDEGDYYDGP